MKKMKKLTALLLTLVMSLALAVPCFAAEPQTASKEDAIYLEAGDTVTIDGITVTLKEIDETEALSAARTVYTPIAPTTTWTKYDIMPGSGTCRKINGDMLGFEINNRGSSSLDLEVWVNLGGPKAISKLFYYTAHSNRMYDLVIEDVFQFSNSVPAEWTVSPNGSSVNFTFSAYQFWSFDN